MPTYRWTICEPDNPNIIEKGSIQKEAIMETFKEFPWIDRLCKVTSMKEDDVCFSPSLEFENIETKQGVSISIVGAEEKYEFYIFYKRPSIIKMFGLFKRHVDNHLSDITGQTKQDAIQFLTAFVNNDTDFMESKMKGK